MKLIYKALYHTIKKKRRDNEVDLCSALPHQQMQANKNIIKTCHAGFFFVFETEKIFNLKAVSHFGVVVIWGNMAYIGSGVCEG